MIWTLNKFGLVSHLRTVPIEKIIKAEIHEHERELQEKLARCHHLLSDSVRETLEAAQANLEAAMVRWQSQLEEYRAVAKTRRHDIEMSYKEVKARLQTSADQLREAIEEWRAAHHFAIAGLTT
jgi:DNA repair exonuclease SbcCD ATPase subunit